MLVAGGVYVGSMVRQSFGHSRTQLPHCTQRKRSMVQVRAGLSTTIAAQGQRFWQKNYWNDKKGEAYCGSLLLSIGKGK